MKLQLMLVLGAFAASSNAAQSIKASEIDGWWRARVTRGSTSDDLYLHFVTSGDRASAKFSIPSVGTDDADIGRFTTTASQVQFTQIGWTLDRSPNGTLSGTIPAALAPYYAFPVAFRRSTQPRIETAPKPVGFPPAPLWKTEVGGPVTGGISFDKRRGNILVATTGGRIAAYKISNGELVWSASANSPVRSAVTVAGENIYVATDASVIAYKAASGAPLWTAPLGKPVAAILPVTDPASKWDHYSASPIVHGDNLVVAARDGCIHFLRLAGGEETRKICVGATLTGTPAIVRDRIYFPAFDGLLRAATINDGKILWSYDSHGPLARDVAQSGQNIVAGSRSYDILAINGQTGKPAWTRYSWWSWADSSPRVTGSEILMGSSDAQRIYSLGATGGRPRWITRLPGWTWPEPARANKLVYAGVVGSTMRYVGKRDGGLAAIDRLSGRLQWFLRTPHADNAPLFGFAAAPLVAEHFVIAADLNGTLFAFAAH